MTQYIVYALGAALLLALAVGGVQTARLSSCQKDLESKKVLIVQQQSAIAQRDAVIEQVAAQGKATADNVKQALQKAEQGKVKAEARTQQIIVEKIPSLPADQVKYLYGIADQLNKAWESGE